MKRVKINKRVIQIIKASRTRGLKRIITKINNLIKGVRKNFKKGSKIRNIN